MPTYTSQYPPAHSDTYVKATTSYPLYDRFPYYATNPANSLIGSDSGASWVSNTGNVTNQRFHIDLGSAKTIRRIYYENYHSKGLVANKGVNNFTLWGSNEASAFNELTYGTDTNWTQLPTSQATFDQHIAADQQDAKYITVTNTTAYRYYAFKFADNHGGTSVMGVRRIELQTEDAPATAPTVTTSTPAANITGISADVTGAITDTGGENASARGICYNTTGTPTTADSIVGETGYQAFGVGSFTKTLTGLDPNTTYHCRAYAINSGGTSYGDEVDFTTLNYATVSTTAISSIAGTTATGGGNVTSEGGAAVTARGCCWNTTGTPTTADSKTTDGAGAGVFASSLTSLTAGVTYYVRAYATNTVGTAYGAQVSFTTLSIPVVTTNSPATNITNAAALISAEILSVGGVNCTERGVCWNTTGSPTTGDDKASEAGTFAAGVFSILATSLAVRTTYYCRAYAINTEGTAYGSQINFTTLSVSTTSDPQVALKDTYYLLRSGRYSNPENSNDRLPVVYGDLTDSTSGNWRLPCIDTVNHVYCFSAAEVLSVANGNSVTIYENNLELNSALYTFDESNDYESKGVIATITFASTKIGSTITARGKGKPTVSAGATLMENIIDEVEDFLTVENNFLPSLFEATAKARASQIFTAQSYKAAGVIHEDINIWELITQMMGSFLGSATTNGDGLLELEIDDGTIPQNQFSGIIRKAEAEFISATQKMENLINQCPASYCYNYAADNEFKCHTDASAHADAISQSIYGIRKPAEPYRFYWCRDITSVQKMQDIIVAKFKYPVWEIEINDNSLLHLDSDAGKFIAFSALHLYDTDGIQLINNIWRVLSFNPDFDKAIINFRLLQTPYHLTTAYIADGAYLADGSIQAGGDRDMTIY